MIIGFIGKIGSGKTLSMVKSAFEKYKKGFTIYTNFKLIFPFKKGYGEIINLDMQFFKDYGKSSLNLLNAIILIDEAHVFFDSRNAMLKRNKIFSKFVTQSRKRSVDLYYTTQDNSYESFYSSGQVELRLRKLTDYIVFCEKVIEKDKLFVVQKIYDNSGAVRESDIFTGDKYFPMFDTNEVIVFDD
jgi:hypothetical protein